MDNRETKTTEPTGKIGDNRFAQWLVSDTAKGRSFQSYPRRNGMPGVVIVMYSSGNKVKVQSMTDSPGEAAFIQAYKQAREQLENKAVQS